MSENEEDINEHIQSIFLEQGKIQAIKAYLEKTGLGLKESKEAVEQIIDPLRDEYPDRFKSGGCAAIALFSAMGLGLFASTLF